MHVSETKRKNPPQTEEELLARCQQIEGLSFLQLAMALEINLPKQSSERKGFAGQIIEQALGSTAGTQALPDFHWLGIELKTIPLNTKCKPAESTFITSIPLLTIHTEVWQTSQCRKKLQRVLWVPVEGDREIPFEERRIGAASLWSPSEEDEKILANDWNDLTTMIATGQLEDIDAYMGEYLQIRPKAMNARSLCYGFDAEGNKVRTLPRGFYLRSRFTLKLLNSFP